MVMRGFIFVVKRRFSLEGGFDRDLVAHLRRRTSEEAVDISVFPDAFQKAFRLVSWVAVIQ
jgi:hypothetical protein